MKGTNAMRRIIAAVLCLLIVLSAIPAVAATLTNNAIPYTVAPIATDAQESPGNVKNLLDGLTSSVYSFVAWRSTTSDETPELTFDFALEDVEGIWLRAGNQRSSMQYEENARPRVIRVRVTTNYKSYVEYTYDIADEYYPGRIDSEWYKGYQLLAFPKVETNVTKIELFVPNWRTGTENPHIVTMTDILFVSRVTTPPGAATPTPAPTSVPWWYTTPTPKPTATPRPTATPTPKVTSVPWWYTTPTPAPTSIPWWYTTPTPQPTDIPWWYNWLNTATPKPTATAQPTAVPANDSIGGALYANVNTRVTLRTGPGNQYENLSAYVNNGSRVEIISSAWDAASNSYWLQVEVTANGKKIRGYAPLSSINIAINQVARETRVDNAYLLRATPAYYGPGYDYQAANITLNAMQQGEICTVENSWALFQYYDTRYSRYRRVWLPTEVLDFSGGHG